MYRLILANQVYVNVQMFSFCYYFCIPSFVYLSFANRTGGGSVELQPRRHFAVARRVNNYVFFVRPAPPTSPSKTNIYPLITFLLEESVYRQCRHSYGAVCTARS